MKIVCSGSIAYDYLMTFPGYFKDHFLAEHLDKISLSFLVDSMTKQRGGIAPNIAYTLALLGERPIVYGTVGEDFGDYRAWLDAQGIDTSHIKTITGKFTASFFANTDLNNNQIASFYTGAMAHASELSLKEFGSQKPDLVVISPDDPTAMRERARECKALGIPYLFDPSQQIARNEAADLREGVEGATSLFVNEYEYELLQKRTGLTSEQIKKAVKFAVVTCGERGALIFEGDKTHLIDAVPVDEILDPTGVGDAFRGGFLRGMSLGVDYETCGRMGSLAAAYCLEQRGTQNHRYTPAEFLARYRKHFDDHGKLDALVS